MAGYADGEHDRARRFRDAALPYVDDVFTLARYLMRNVSDAEDAVQECYLRALRHFDTYRGPAMKPWLLTILRNVCNAEFARRGKQELSTECSAEKEAETYRCGRSRRPPPKQRCCGSTTTTQSASSSPRCPNSFARLLCCVR